MKQYIRAVTEFIVISILCGFFGGLGFCAAAYAGTLLVHWLR